MTSPNRASNRCALPPLAASVAANAKQLADKGVGFARRGAENVLSHALVLGAEMAHRTEALREKGATLARRAMDEGAQLASRPVSQAKNQLEEVFTARVEAAMRSLGIPSREEVLALSARVDELTAILQKMNAARSRKKVAKPVSAGRSRKRIGT